MSEAEFSPEQQVMVAILAWAGEPDPEGIVRAERVEAYRLGSHLRPVLQQLAKAAADLLEAFADLVDDEERS